MSSQGSLAPPFVQPGGIVVTIDIFDIGSCLVKVTCTEEIDSME